MKEINLKGYRPTNSLSFSGRPQGESVRKALKLDQIEQEFDEISFKIPADTTSFNPSFFLGLFYDSIKKLGVEKFKSKYHLDIEAENSILRDAIDNNIQDGFRNAINSMKNKNVFNIFGAK